MSFCFTFLGSGTSQGVPIIGKEYPPEFLANPKNWRTRSAIYLATDKVKLVVDTPPDFRMQCLREKINWLDAVIFTHSHADHIMGLDDLRPFNFLQRELIPIYAAPPHLDYVKRVFPYIFDEAPSESSRPRIVAHEFDETSVIELFGLAFQPLRLAHGKGVSYGFRFGPAAYLTDHSDIPQESLDREVRTQTKDIKDVVVDLDVVETS